MEATPLLADVPWQIQQLFVQAITANRQAIFDAGNVARQALITAAQKAAVPTPTTPARIPPQLKLNPNLLVSRHPGGQVFEFNQTTTLGAAAPAPARQRLGRD